MDNHTETQDKRLIETLALENTITLRLFDDSKQLPADRWQVALTARLEIPVESLYRTKPAALPHPDELRAAIGDPLVYEHRNVRQFVDAKEKQDLLESLIDTFKSKVFPYIIRPDFHVNYAAVKYKEHQKRKTWYPDG